MATMRTLGQAALGWVCLASLAFAVDCPCNLAKPETMALRQCSLCNEAEKQDPNTLIFFLKDINPTKPTRWLALPRTHGIEDHDLQDLPRELQAKLWVASVQRAKEMWGDQWGLAYNGPLKRTQCHTHIHIGKWITVTENDQFEVFDRPEDIVIHPGEGAWVHPVNGKLHVHFGEQATETVLLR